jgi:predicted metal-dependent HD superfamily phosphohydrolase
VDESLLRPLWARDAGTVRGADAALTSLLVRYGEPHRHYHTVRHLAAVLVTVDDLLREVPVVDRAAIRLAAWFHDAVYDPRAPAGANEKASADLADRLLANLGHDANRRREVRRLVLVTASHTPSSDDEAVLVDADLAVLSERPAVYEAYRNGVRAEYAHVDDTAWSLGRRAVLQRFLDRPAIYTTRPMRAREALARANLTAELASLG